MRRWLTWGAIALGALILAVNATATAAYIYDSTQADAIAPGISIAGIEVGGLSAAAARARLANVLVPRLQQPVTLAYQGQQFTVDPRRAGLRIDVDRMVDAAVARSREGGLLTRFVREVRGSKIRETLPLNAVYSTMSVDRFVARVARTVNRAPRSATVVPSAEALRIVRARWGVAVRRHVLARMLQRRLVDPRVDRVVRIPVLAKRPAITTSALPRKFAAFITVDRENFRLTFWKNLKPFKRYPIAVGRSGLETPAGLYHIDDKQVNPSWHVPKSPWAGDLAGRVIPPGPDDPIKARWMGFYNGAGVHGTDDVGSLGSAASHGCIRMSIPDVIELYELVPLGTPIYVG